MSFKAKTRKPGDLIKSEDWNDAMSEIENLGNTKVGIDGGALNGPLKITGQLGVTGDENEWVVDGSEKDQLKIKSGDQQKLVITDQGGVGIGMENSNPGLAVDGPVVRKVWVATGLGPIDGRDSGPINERMLNFTKYHRNSAIRIAYHDCFRVLSANNTAGSGRWEILVNNTTPPGGRIFQDFHDYTGNYSDNHHPTSIIGYAKGLTVGQHIITVHVGDVEGHSNPYRDRYTGWHNSRWTIEAEEIWVQE